MSIDAVVLLGLFLAFLMTPVVYKWLFNIEYENWKKVPHEESRYPSYEVGDNTLVLIELYWLSLFIIFVVAGKLLS